MTKQRGLQVACLVLFLGLAAARFINLSDRPLHHDEGVNSHFLRSLITKNIYQYDPANYHGPTLYYFQVPTTWGATLLRNGPLNFTFKSDQSLTVSNLRFNTAMVGCLLLLLLFFSRPFTGPYGRIASTYLAGISCSILFVSRYFIHEIYLVAFNLALILSLAYFNQSKKPHFFYAAAASAALMFCTKETAVLHFGLMAFAYIFTPLLNTFLDDKAESPRSIYSRHLSAFCSIGKFHAAYAALLAFSIWLVLFSSFFTNVKGLTDSIRTFLYWGREGVESGHNKPFLFYIKDMMARYEMAILVFSFCGVAMAFIKKEFKGIFLMLWTIGTVLMYSIIPYKTPWCVINLLLPMILLSGYGIQKLLEIMPHGKGILISGIILLSVLQVPQSVRVVYKEYDNERHPIVYSHTTRDILNLVREVETVSQNSRQGFSMPITVVSPEYWPLPFYFLRFPQAHFYGTMENVDLSGPVIIGASKQKDALLSKLSATHAMKEFTLRPGEKLQVYVRESEDY